MTGKVESHKPKKYDLGERTARFGEAVIDFAKTIKPENVNRSIINQLVRSSTSVGANYMEADCAESKKDFYHKIALCKKEAKETTHWLRMLSRSNRGLTDQCKVLWKEAHELTLIFSTIINNKKI